MVTTACALTARLSPRGMSGACGMMTPASTLGRAQLAAINDGRRYLLRALTDRGGKCERGSEGLQREGDHGEEHNDSSKSFPVDGRNSRLRRLQALDTREQRRAETQRRRAHNLNTTRPHLRDCCQAGSIIETVSALRDCDVVARSFTFFGELSGDEMDARVEKQHRLDDANEQIEPRIVAAHVRALVRDDALQIGCSRACGAFRLE